MTFLQWTKTRKIDYLEVKKAECLDLDWGWNSGTTSEIKLSRQAGSAPVYTVNYGLSELNQILVYLFGCTLIQWFMYNVNQPVFNTFWVFYDS